MTKKLNDGGVNSFIEEIESKTGEKIIYKKYKNNDRQRMDREINFLVEQGKNKLEMFLHS